jgi:hypothetical protein
LIVMLAILEYYMLVRAREEMLLASRLGARVASARASDAHSDSDRAAAAAEAIKTARVALKNGSLSKADIEVTWSQDVSKKDPSATAGEADWVHVEVKIKARQVVPDVLGWVGFTLGSRDIVAGNTMMQE